MEGRSAKRTKTPEESRWTTRFLSLLIIINYYYHYHHKYLKRREGGAPGTGRGAAYWWAGDLMQDLPEIGLKTLKCSTCFTMLVV